MPRWLPRVLARIHELASIRKATFTHKAKRELAAIGLGLDETDACDILGALGVKDFAARMASTVTGEWMYVFKPCIAGTVVYTKLILRTHCVVLSFHEVGDIDDSQVEE